MEFRTTRQITYTPPPTRAEARTMAEIAAIDSEQEPAPDAAARRAALAAGLQPVTQVRITVGTLSAYQYGKYEAYRRQFRAWIEEETGQPTAAALETPAGQNMIELGLQWARARAAMIRLETRQTGRLDDDDDAGPWNEISPPATWDTPAGYLREIPADLAETLAEAAEDANPGLFVPAMDDDAKKNGGISVE